jgi:hypothetical protein
MTNQAFWSFEQIGVADRERGHTLTAPEIYCVVCLYETGRQVRLHRWEVVEVDNRWDIVSSPA